MTQVIKAVATIPNKDPLIDSTDNIFVFESDTATDYSEVSAIYTAIINFYTVAGTGGGNAIDHYFSDSHDAGTNHASITLYDISTHLNGTPAGAPVAMENWTCPGGGSGNPCPEGVAAAISYRRDYGTDVEFGTGTRPRSRDRGRIYVGPVSSVALDEDGTTNRCIWKAQFITDCLAAAYNLSEGHTAGGTEYVWRQWSRKNASVGLITELFMDNRPDYQRRRSDDAPGFRTYRASAAV